MVRRECKYIVSCSRYPREVAGLSVVYFATAVKSALASVVLDHIVAPFSDCITRYFANCFGVGQSPGRDLVDCVLRSAV